MGFEDHYIVHGVPKPLEPGLTCTFYIKVKKTQDTGLLDHSTLFVTFLPVVINFVPSGK